MEANMSSTGQWYLAKEGDWYSIRRIVGTGKSKKHERFPKKKYRHIKDLEELRDFVIRLNGKDPRIERIKGKLEFRHAFINEEMLDKYYEYLRTQIPNERDASTLFQYLKKYALGFFIQKLDMANPLDWHQHQHIWSKYLLNRADDLKDEWRIFEKDRIVSSKVLKYIVNEMNRFCRFLHNQKPDIPALTFEPLSKAALKDHKARRKLKGVKHNAQYITPVHWEKIREELDENEWKYPILLAFYYGLRRNEAMGLELSDVKKSCLFLTKQFDKVENTKVIHKPLKSRNSRKIPHWFLTPAKAYNLIQEMSKNTPLHPDTLGDYFSSLCEGLELPRYTLHDLRRTFITNAVRKGIEPEELRLAVGHANAETTYQYYVMDSRELDLEDFVPEVS